MRPIKGAIALALSTFVMLPVLAQAAEEAHGGSDPVKVDYWQALFTIIVFVVLLIILSKAAFKPILVGLQNREKFIREALETAKQEREQAEARLKEYEQRLLKAGEEASAIVDEGRRDAETVKRRIEEEARQSSDAMIERAKREIGLARDTAVKDLYEQSAQLAMEMAGSVLKRQLAPEDHQRLVQDALTELRQKANGGFAGKRA